MVNGHSIARGQRPALRAFLVGHADDFLEELLADVLRELSVRIDVGLNPDLVLTVVGRDDVREVVGRARRIGGSAPIVAILPFGDETMAREAIRCGARITFDLDQPIGTLLSALMPVVSELLNAPGRDGVVTAPNQFRLGPHARAMLQKVVATTSPVSGPEAVRRLEQAIQLDAFLNRIRRSAAAKEGNTVERPAPGALGTHARLEALLLHVDAGGVAALEEAIQRDARDALPRDRAG